MQILDDFRFPTTAIFNNIRELENLCKYLEQFNFEVYHESEISFPFKGFVTYDFVNRLVIIKWCGFFVGSFFHTCGFTIEQTLAILDILKLLKFCIF